MNIFVLDTNPDVCAEMHCDKHVVKMILESAQLLSGAVNLAVDHQLEGLYKTTHKNHPCSIWTRQTRENFLWLVDLGLSLCAEYTFRYGKDHKSRPIIEQAFYYSDLLPSSVQTPFAQAMPEQYRAEDAVTAYRNYYRTEKASIAQWTKRMCPEWFCA